MRDYRQFAVHDKAHRLALRIYAITASFPAEERFGLIGQMRRAATSIPINVAEGAGRDSDVDFARFVDIAMGSANELEYELLLARDLEYLSHDDHDQLAEATVEVRRMLNGLRKRLRSA